MKKEMLSLRMRFLVIPLLRAAALAAAYQASFRQPCFQASL